MVMIFLPRRSILREISSVITSFALALVSALTRLGNVMNSPLLRIRLRISLPFSPFLAMISVILPSARRPLSGYCVIFATTLSPVFAFLENPFFINTSSVFFRSSGTTKPKFLFFWKVPTTSFVFLSNIFVTIPSLDFVHKYGGSISTSTRSPFIAPAILSGAI